MMRNRINKIIIAAFFVVLTPVTLFSQQDSSTLQRELTIEKEYNPTVRDASKINTLPEVETPVPVKIQAEYAANTLSRDSENKSLKTLDGGNNGLNYPFSKQKFYLNFGGGNYTNLDGNLGAIFVDNESDQVGISFSHQSTNGARAYNQLNVFEDIDVETARARTKSMDNFARFFYTHHFRNASLKVDIDYLNSSFNYFGNYFHRLSIIKIYDIDYKSKQNHNNIKGAVKFFSQERDGEINYSAAIGYSHFGKDFFAIPNDGEGVKEGNIFINGELQMPLQEVYKLGLGVDFNSFSYSSPALNNEEYRKERGFENYALLGLNPYFGSNSDLLDIRLGAKVEFQFNKGRAIMLAPDVKLDFKFGKGYTLYLHAGGGTEFMTFNASDKLNRYVNPSFRVEDVYAPIDASLGLKGNVGYGFFFQLFGGWKWYDENNFFFQQQMDNIANVSEVIRMKAYNLKVGGQINYKYDKYLDLKFKIQKNNWKAGYINDKVPDYFLEGVKAQAWNMPNLEIEAGIESEVMDGLTLSLLYYLGTDRVGLARLRESEVHYRSPVRNMDNISELSFGARYAFLQHFNVFGKVNNLLNSKYDILYGMPSQGINFMVGAGVKF